MKFERDRAIAAIRKRVEHEKEEPGVKTRLSLFFLLAYWPIGPLAYGHVADTIFTALSRM
jgi:hypothetical protein